MVAPPGGMGSVPPRPISPMMATWQRWGSPTMALRPVVWRLCRLCITSPWRHALARTAACPTCRLPFGLVLVLQLAKTNDRASVNSAKFHFLNGPVPEIAHLGYLPRLNFQEGSAQKRKQAKRAVWMVSEGPPLWLPPVCRRPPISHGCLHVRCAACPCGQAFQSAIKVRLLKYRSRGTVVQLPGAQAQSGTFNGIRASQVTAHTPLGLGCLQWRGLVPFG